MSKSFKNTVPVYSARFGFVNPEQLASSLAPILHPSKPKSAHNTGEEFSRAG